MNAQLNTFFTALGAVAASAVLALALAEPADGVSAPASQEVVKLERVVIVGQAVRGVVADVAVSRRIEKLPRVVVSGRRAEGTLQLAMAPACTAQQGC